MKHANHSTLWTSQLQPIIIFCNQGSTASLLNIHILVYLKYAVAKLKSLSHTCLRKEVCLIPPFSGSTSSSHPHYAFYKLVANGGHKYHKNQVAQFQNLTRIFLSHYFLTVYASSQIRLLTFLCIYQARRG